jgi:two-component system, LytTR family, sensor kinase
VILINPKSSSMVIKRSDNNWFFKYKLYHLPLWFLYHWMWWSINDGDPLKVINGMLSSPFILKFGFYFVFQAIGVYFNLYFLIPRFLDKGRYILYIFLVMLTIMTTAALIVPGYYASAWLAGKAVDDLFYATTPHYMYFFKANSLPSSMASMTLAMSVKLAKKWIDTRKRERMLEKEKIETELKFLKSQFNPHFLFNTINSIFVLIHKDPEMASASLAKFSDLLRYQLYECNEHHIPLNQEITYLRNFIELEKLRQEKNVFVELDIAPELPGDFSIAPFILIPFVENAFKHVSHSRQSNRISIKLQTDKGELYFNVVNSISSKDIASQDMIKQGGIGLMNVQRRLQLLYAGKHELKIIREEDEYCVSLRLQPAQLHSMEYSFAPEPMSLASAQIKQPFNL